LAAGLALIVVSIWVFYLHPMLGWSWSGLSWMVDRREPIFAWWPSYLTPSNQPGVLAAICAVVLFALAFLRQHPRLRTALPEAPDWAPTSCLRSVDGRFQWWRALLFALALSGALGLLVYQAAVVASGGFTGVLAWSGCFGLALLAAIAWDWRGREDLARTAAGLFIAFGTVACLLGTASMMRSQPPALVLLVGGLVLFAIGLKVGRRFGSTVAWWEHVGLLLLALIVLGYAMSRAESWRFACEGDEWNFYYEPRDMLLGVKSIHPLAAIPNDHLNSPFAYTLIAATMKVAGISVFGWRLSSVLPFVLSLAPVYFFLRWLCDRRAAALGACLLAGSYFLHNFCLIGYNNTHGPMPLTFGLGFYAFASERRCLTRYVLAGGAFGLMMLVYAVGRLAAIPMALLFVFVTWRFRRAMIPACVAAALGFLAISAPMLFRLSDWQHQLAVSTPLGTSPAGWGKDQLAVSQIAHNAVSALFVFLIAGQGSHHIHGPHADPLTAALVLVGYGFLLAHARRYRVAGVWLAASVLFALAVGGHQQYPFIKNTRLFILVPMNAILAGLGGSALIGMLGRQRRVLPLCLTACLAVSGVALNMFHLYRVAAPFSGDTWVPQLVRQFQETAAADGGGMPVFLITDDNASFALGIARAHGVAFERMMHLTPAEAIQSALLSRARAGPAMALIRVSNSDDQQRIFGWIESQWPGAAREEVRNGPSLPAHLYRYLTPLGRQEFLKVPKERASLVRETFVLEVPGASSLAAGGPGEFCALSPIKAAVYCLVGGAQLQPVALEPEQEWTSLVLLPGDQMVVGGAAGLRWYQRSGKAIRRLGPEQGVGHVRSLVSLPGHGMFALTVDGNVLNVSDEGEIGRLPVLAERALKPTAIAAGPEGRLWVSLADGRLVELSPDGRVLSEQPFPNLQSTFAVLPDRSIVYPERDMKRVVQRDLSGGLRHVFSGIWPDFVALAPQERPMLADSFGSVAVVYPPAGALGLISSP
jgi:hypothetical protein